MERRKHNDTQSLSPINQLRVPLHHSAIYTSMQFILRTNVLTPESYRSSLHYRGPNQCTPQYGTEGFKKEPILELHYAQRHNPLGRTMTEMAFPSHGNGFRFHRHESNDKN